MPDLTIRGAKPVLCRDHLPPLSRRSPRQPEHFAFIIYNGLTGVMQQVNYLPTGRYHSAAVTRAVESYARVLRHEIACGARVTQPLVRRPRVRGAGRPRASSTRSSARSGDSGDPDGSGPAIGRLHIGGAK